MTELLGQPHSENGEEYLLLERIHNTSFAITKEGFEEVANEIWKFLKENNMVYCDNDKDVIAAPNDFI